MLYQLFKLKLTVLGLFPEFMEIVSSGDIFRGRFCCCVVGCAKADCLSEDNDGNDKLERANVENKRINIIDKARRFFITL